jgi:hypothetical protein
MANHGMGDLSKPGGSPRSPQSLDLKREMTPEGPNERRKPLGGRSRRDSIDATVTRFLTEYQSVEDKFLP